jgi:hypothetical protein
MENSKWKIVHFGRLSVKMENGSAKMAMHLIKKKDSWHDFLSP